MNFFSSNNLFETSTSEKPQYFVDVDRLSTMLISGLVSVDNGLVDKHRIR